MNVLPTSAIKTTLEAAPRVARTMPSGEAPIVDQFTAVGGSAPREAAPATAESPATAPAAKPAATSVTIPRALLCETPTAPALAPVIEGYDRSYLDTSVRPQDDFYQYAVGGYIKNNPIPEDRDRYGVRTELYERIQNTLRGILDDAAAQTDAPLGSVAQKIGDFYASAMNTDAIEAAGAKPLQPMFERIARLQTTGDVAEEVANLHGSGYGGLFAFGASQDMKNPEMIIAETSQGGLSLPGKEYYLKDDERSVKVRAAFVDHMTKMFQLLGDDAETAARNARTVMDVETSMAKGAMARVEMRDPKALDHITSREELRQMAPHFDWNRYFSTLGTPSFETLNVATPNFFKTLDEQLATRPVEDWKTYLRWKVIDQSAGFLSADFEKQNFEFKGKALSGTPTQTERWKRMVNLTDGFLGEAVGQKFVEKTFPPEAKARALEMVDNIKFVLRDRIENLTWMGPETKKEALAKIDRLRVKIGYPDRWKDYSGLEIDRGVLMENILRARQFEAERELATIGQPVDREKWEMTPSTVNAYYHPLLNEIVFPAARLQPPFFDMAADDAANYGATCVTIGHELTHGFDDSGAQFDSKGYLREWWQPEDFARFKTLADRVEHQYDEFEYDGQKVDGGLVKGEAMADLGGLELAYAALQKSLKEKGRPESRDGFSPEQRFYLGYALCREEAQRKEAAHLQITTDPHPLGEFRVNGPLSNLPEFHKAFACKPGDKMVRAEEKRTHLWS